MGGKKAVFLSKDIYLLVRLSNDFIIDQIWENSNFLVSANFAQTQFFDEIFIFSKFILTEFSFVYFADFVISG